MTANEYKVSFWLNENALKLDYGDVCRALNIRKGIELYTLMVEL